MVYKKACDRVVAQAKGQTCSLICFTWWYYSSVNGQTVTWSNEKSVSKNSKYKQFLRFWVVVIAERICGGSGCGDDGKLTTSIFATSGRIHIIRLGFT